MREPENIDELRAAMLLVGKDVLVGVSQEQIEAAVDEIVAELTLGAISPCALILGRVLIELIDTQMVTADPKTAM